MGKALRSICLLGMALLIVAPPAFGGALTDEVKCETQKVKFAGKSVAKIVKVCLKRAAQKNEDPAECITAEKAKLDKKMTATEARFTTCPTKVDSAELQSLLGLYAGKIADAAASNYQDITPCNDATVDKWTFEAGAGEEVRVVADTVGGMGKAADLYVTLQCTTDGVLVDGVSAGDDDAPCTYAPDDGYECPDATVTSTVAQSCTVTVGVASNSSCSDGASAPYRLRVNTSKHTPLTLTQPSDNIAGVVP